MAQIDAHLSTGLPGLDSVLIGLIPGDNIVFQVESIEDYKFFLRPYLISAKARGRKLLYFRFGNHEPLVKPSPNTQIVVIDPLSGFEKFISDIHRTIAGNDNGTFYVFDSLSGLAVDWYSDQMLGCFFMLTCPYLYDVEAIAYFAINRRDHSLDAITPIHDTAQVIINVFRRRDTLYIQPHKVQRRHSTSMFMLHIWDGERFRPVTESAITSEIMISSPGFSQGGFSDNRAGYVNNTFFEAEQMMAAILRGERAESECGDIKEKLLRMIVSRDAQMLRLAKNNLSLTDILDIRKRMVGTGLIGGKSVGMLLARAILKRLNPRWANLLEEHDSFFIGSDVFYNYVVRNGSWWIRERQKDNADPLIGANEARRKILTGSFPESISRQFLRILDYYGQSPIIVRSSSLLEDNYGNAFSGKYESVFCANQGSRDNRLEDMLTAVRNIYMSTLSESALSYRAKRGLLDLDEHMALLVQRVSGSLNGRFFFPQVAGVGYSYNPYVWNSEIEPKAGMLRLVFGLGTRAVDRRDDDYTRVVALNAPDRRPESNFDKICRYAQRKIDILDLDANQLRTIDFEEIQKDCPNLDTDLFTSVDAAPSRKPRANADSLPHRVLTFDQLLQNTDFVADMREMLSSLESVYNCPVDTEFTANFFPTGGYRINLLQCRPLQAVINDPVDEPPEHLTPEEVVLDAYGAVIGKNLVTTLDYIVYVSADAFGQLPNVDKYSVARLVGKVMRCEEFRNDKKILLAGPGRWGSSMPELGVTVAFSEIGAASILCEIVAMSEYMVPDVSLGTHFFNDLVEADILYIALFPSRGQNMLNEKFLSSCRNHLLDFVPGETKLAEAVRVIRAADLPDQKKLRINASIMKQRALCYIG